MYMKHTSQMRYVANMREIINVGIPHVGEMSMGADSTGVKEDTWSCAKRGRDTWSMQHKWER